MKFSVIAACRGRYDALRRFINSVFLTANHPESVELHIMCDTDDPQTFEIARELYQANKWNVVIVRQERRQNLNKYYINLAASLAIGKYLWVLGNDMEVATKGWDDILTAQMESFVLDKPDRLCYVYVDDDIHKQGEYGGCCIPLITKESFLATGFYMPPDCTTWAADHWLWMIYSQLKENRILSCYDVKVLHHAYHTKRAERDEVSYEVERNSVVSEHNVRTVNNAIAKLNAVIS